MALSVVYLFCFYPFTSVIDIVAKFPLLNSNVLRPGLIIAMSVTSSFKFSGISAWYVQLSSGLDNPAINSSSICSNSGATPATTAISESGSLLYYLY